MLRERIADGVYVFTSDLYAQVTAGAIITPEGAIIIDTLPFPKETREIIAFVKKNCARGVRYVVNTHFHADHTYGTYLFEDADVVAHQRCREALLKYGEESLKEAKEVNPELAEVQLRLPNVVFDGELTLRLGKKSVQLMLLPGHTADSIAAYVKESKVLFAGDAVMPVPYIVWGDREQMIESLRAISKLPLENIVQGHGEVLLRGEVGETLETSISYLDTIYNRVRKVVESGGSAKALSEIDIESCGKSRIPLNGLVQQLHLANLHSLYERMMKDTEKANDFPIV